jgi:cation diffusion facilitator CzcD-associated flavoprotein CzcO
MSAAVKQVSTDAALLELTNRVRHDLQCLDYPAHKWVRAHKHASGQHVYDAVIIGGGQSGLSVAFGLLREKVDNILVLDENVEGHEGPWVTYARMVTLRTPKYLTGPDLGVASLTFRAFWEAQYGEESWEGLGKVPRQEWMRYLRWFRATLEIPFQNETKVDLIEPVERGLFRLNVSGEGAKGSLLARKVVLATGIQGGGEWHMPSFITSALPKHLYAHTSGPIDYNRLIGKKIGILGGGASAFDNAQFALGVGVAEAHVFMRRREMPRINPIRFMENAGFLRHFADIDDAAKYESMDFFLNHSQPPTNDTFMRASAYPGFHLHLGQPWLKVEQIEDGVRVTTPEETHDYAFIVASTGLLTDVGLRPELGAVGNDIAHWRDVFRPAAGKANKLIDDHPYLGPSFEFLPRVPEAADRLHGLFVFNYSALVSLGLSAAALSGMKYAAPRVVAGITRQLFTDDQSEILSDFLAYAEEEFVH